MTSPGSIPAEPISFYAYVVIDISTDPPTPIRVELTRREAREFIKWSENPAPLRIRRARVKLYHK